MMTNPDPRHYRDFDRLVRKARFEQAVCLGEALADGSAALARALSRTAVQVQRSFIGTPVAAHAKRPLVRR